jgi:hypothetical protein
MRYDLLLTLCVEIYSANCSLNLVEADVIEAFEARTTDCSDSVIRYQEVFLPSHEYVVSLAHIWDVKVALLRRLLQWSESGKFSPMLEVDFVI